MEEYPDREFHAEIRYDLPTYKELTKANLLYSRRTNASKIFLMVMILFFSYMYGIVLEQASFLSFLLLLYLGIFWGIEFLRFLRSRNGDLAFNRMLSSNNGKPPHTEITFTEENIRIHNPDSNGCNTTAYSQLRAVFETEHFLIFLQEYRLYSAIQKDSVTGGTVDELLEFVFEKSAFLKKKKLSSLLPGKIIKAIFIAFSVLCLLAALWFSHPVQIFVHKQQSINNFMSYHQIADQLENLGITGIDDKVLEELEAYDREYDYSYSYGIGSKAFALLCWEGMGEYEDGTWEWTPSDSGVYWFDMEVLYPDTMYTDFLIGVQALDPEALDFTDVAEDLSQVNYEDGTGIQRVSFSWNGKSHMLEAIVDYDWFDLYAAADLADIVKAENTGKRLYFAFDGGQGVLVFYNTPEWSKAFEKATGIPLFDDPRSI